MRIQISLKHNINGSLSITALWILALLSLLGVSLMRNQLVGIRLAGYKFHETEATWIARAGIQHAITVLKNDMFVDSLQSFDAFSEAWAQNPELFQKLNCGNGFFEISYSTREIPISGKSLFGVLDENRKININRAPEEILKRLPGMTQPKLAALLDWRDEDSTKRNGGAENPFYLQSLPPYRCKNADLEFVEELSLIRNFTDEDVRILKDLITVYGEGQVNINTASAEVMAILGMTADLAEKIAHSRWGEDEIPFTRDDVIFRNETDIVNTLTKLIKIKPSQQALLHRLISEDLLGVHSTHFTIHSTGVVQDGQVIKEISATIERINPKEIKIVAWKEYAVHD